MKHLVSILNASGFEKVHVQSVDETELHVLIKSWDHTSNGEIDENAVEETIKRRLDSGFKVRAYQDGDEWANVYITKEVSK